MRVHLIIAFLASLISTASFSISPNCLNCTTLQSGATYDLEVFSKTANTEFDEIKGIKIFLGNKLLQTLPIHEYAPWVPKGHLHEIKKIDLNADGLEEFAFLSFNAINRFFDYYLFNAQTKKYIYLGNFPEFEEVDGKNRQFKATLKDAGGLYRLTYELKENKIVETKKEKIN